MHIFNLISMASEVTEGRIRSLLFQNFTAIQTYLSFKIYSKLCINDNIKKMQIFYNVKLFLDIWPKHTFYFYDPYPFCAYFGRYMLSPGLRAKRVGVIKDEICILKIQYTLLLSRIYKKCQYTQLKTFLCFELKREHKEMWLFVFRYIKSLFIAYPCTF